jgi:hypothetical protein
MTSEEIQHIIEAELADNSDISNMHGVDLSESLIKPIKQIYLCKLPILSTTLE